MQSSRMTALRVVVMGLLVSEASALATKSSRSHQAPHKEQVFTFKDTNVPPKTTPSAAPELAKPDIEALPKEFNASLVNILKLSVFFNVAICFLWLGSKTAVKKEVEKPLACKECGDVCKETSCQSTSPASAANTSDLHVTMGSSCIYEPAPRSPGYVPSRSVKNSPLKVTLSSLSSSQPDAKPVVLGPTASSFTTTSLTAAKSTATEKDEAASTTNPTTAVTLPVPLVTAQGAGDAAAMADELV